MAPTKVDDDLYGDLKKNILTVTKSGLKTCDPSALKTIKSICRKSNEYVFKCFGLLKDELKRQHSEARYSSFLICIELFPRSNYFRELFINDLREIFELTIESNLLNLLPPPKTAADDLKKLALETYHSWNQQYGKQYKQLSVGYEFLKNCQKVDFVAMETRNNAERERQLAEQQRLKMLNEEKTLKLDKEISDNAQDIRDSITTLKNCTSLLIPTLDTFFINDKDEQDIFSSTSSTAAATSSKVDLKCHGIPTNFQINININPQEKLSINRTSENEVIIQNAEESVRIINNKMIPLVKKWIKTMTKLEHKQLRDIINLKEELEQCKKKYIDLNITADLNDDSSDDDLEEVQEKEGYEDTVVEPISEPYGTNSKNIMTPDWSLSLSNEEKNDPTVSLPTIFGCFKKQGMNIFTKSETTTLPLQKESESHNRKEKLLSVAPKLPYDIDLYHWEDKEVTAPTRFAVKMENHSFWSASSVDEMQDIPVPEGELALRTRVIEFSGNYEPVKWMCRAPLPSGVLCPRKDRVKCPFHGKIVARDEKGQCVNKEDEKTTKDDKPKVPDWQDPQLLAELKASTGIDLSAPVRGRGRRKKNKSADSLPGLTNLKARTNTSYTRLAKKIFNKTAMKRVAASMNRFERRKFRDKYGDQFNYVHDTC